MDGVNAEEELIDRWLLEFACHNAVKEFIETGNVDIDQTRDFIDAIVQRAVRSQIFNSKTPLGYFIILVCKLSDGETYNIQYMYTDKDGASESTPLEEALQYWESLLKCCCKNDSGSKQYKDITTRLKTQAVFVCCRDGDFQTAEEVKNRLWPKAGNVPKEVTAVLQSKSKRHEILKKFSYKGFIDDITEVIANFYSSMKTPFLVQAAKSFIREQSKENKTARRRHRSEKDEDVLANSKILSACILKESLAKLKAMEKEKKSSAITTQTVKRKLNISGGGGDASHADQDVYQFSEEESSPTKMKRPVGRPRKHGHTPVNTLQKVSRSASRTPKRGGQTPSRTPQKGSSSKSRARNDLHSSDGSQTPKSQLPSFPRGRHVLRRSLGPRSSPKKIQSMSVSNRTKNPWSEEEVEKLIKGVKRFGQGKWAEIKREFRFYTRTSVHLKDKWRTLHQRGMVEYSPTKHELHWTEDEVDALHKAVEKYGTEWSTITASVPELSRRSISGLMTKWRLMHQKQH